MATSISQNKRSKVIDRYGPFCFYCGSILNASNNNTYDLDHFVAKASGGTNSDSNLVPSCKSCNRTKGRRDVERFRTVKALDTNGLPRFSDDQLDVIKDITGHCIVPVYTFFFEIMGYDRPGDAKAES